MAWRPSTPGLVEIVTLKGNHEDLACRFLQGDMEAGRHWFDYDGMDALVDYGVIATDPAARDDASLLSLRDRFAQALPPPHLAFLQALSISHREGDYHFVHAGVRPGVVLADQNDQDQMWIRKRFLESEVEHGAIVVHGHSISAQPEVWHNRIGIDTGAYASGGHSIHMNTNIARLKPVVIAVENDSHISPVDDGQPLDQRIVGNDAQSAGRYHNATAIQLDQRSPAVAGLSRGIDY